MAGAFASAYVEILPKMADFGAQLKRALGGIKNVEVPVSLKFDPGKIATQLADLRKPLEVSVMPVLDDAKAKGALTDLRKPVDISVTPVIDDAKARAALTDLDKPLDISVRPVLEDNKVRGALADLQRALVVPLEVRLDGKARGELADLTRTETKIIEVDYVTKGGKDPFDSFSAAGTAAGEKAGGNVTAGLTGALASGMKGPAALLVGGLGIKAVVDSGGDFQVAMKKIEVQTGASAEQMARVDALTLQLGKDQKLGAASAGDAAAAIQVLTKGQFSLEESMKVARSALQLSIVSNQDAAVATGQLATAMAQLKVPVKDAAAVVDSLAAADLKGIIGNAQDYATAIQYAGTSWTQAFKNQAPLDRLYDLQTALVTLDNQAGITGSAAGTTIRRMMIDMTGPTEKAKNGIRDLTTAFQKNGGVLRDGGSVFVTAAGQMRPLTESIDNLDLAFKNLNPQQVMDLLEPVFTTVGKEGVQLLRDGRGSWDEYRIAIMRAGIAQELADAQAVGLKGAFSGLAGALETTAIQTAKAISPYLIPAINGIGTAVSVLGTVLPPAIGLMGELIGKLTNTAPVQGFLDVLGRVKDAVKGAFEVPGGGTSPDPFSAAQKGIRDGRTETEKWKQVLVNLREEFPLLDAAAGFIEQKIVPAFKKIGQIVREDVMPALDKVGQWVQTTAPGVQGFFKDLGTIGAAGAGAVKFALDLVNAFDGVKTIIEGVIQLFSGITDIVSGVVGTVAALIRGDFSGAWDHVKDIVGGVKDVIVGLGKITFGPLIAAIGGIASKLGDLTGKAWRILVDAGGAAKDWILGRLSDVKSLVGKGWKVAVEGAGNIKNWIGDRFSDLRRLTQSIWKPIVNVGGEAIQQIRNIASALKGLAGRTLRVVVDFVIGAGKAIYDRVVGGTKDAFTQNVGGKGTFVSTTPKKVPTTPAPKAVAAAPKAEGGPVRAGTPYIVGEEGPELFFPRISGEIFTNKDSAKLLKQAKEKSFDAAGIIAKVLVRTPGSVQGSPVDKTFATLSSSFNEIVTAVDQATTSIGDMADGAVDFVDQVGRSSGDFVDTVTDTAGNLVDDVDAAGTTIVGIAGGLGTGIGNIIQVTSGEIIGIVGGLEGNVDTAGTNIVGIIGAAGTQIGGITQDTSTEMAGIAAGLATNVEDAGTDIADTVIDYIVPAAQSIADALGENSPLDGAIEGVGDGLGDVGTGLGDLQVDLSAITSSSVVLAFDTLSNVINFNVLPAFDGFVAKLNSFTVPVGEGNPGDPLPVSAVGPNGESIVPTYIVPAGSPSNAETIPGSGGNPANTPGGTGGPLPYTPGDNVPGSGGNPNNTPGGSGGPISTAPTIPLPGPIANVVTGGIAAAIGAIGTIIPRATLLMGAAADAGLTAEMMSSAGAALSESAGGLRGNDTLADKVGEAVKEALAEAGLDRPNLGGVYVNTEIPGWQVATLVDKVMDRVDQRLAAGR